jgi:uncharacterized membrane protein
VAPRPAPAADPWAPTAPPNDAPSDPPAGSWQPRAASAAPENRKGSGAGGASRLWSIIWGVILLAVGIWFLLDVTLAFDMPSVSWRDVWPIVLIAVGVAVVVRSGLRRSA